MLLKKTLVRFGSMLLSTHFDHVSRTLPYAIGRGISSYSVAPSSKDPRLLHISPHHDKQYPNQFHEFAPKKKRYFKEIGPNDVVLTELS